MGGALEAAGAETALDPSGETAGGDAAGGAVALALALAGGGVTVGSEDAFGVCDVDGLPFARWSSA